jgi:hypothetical protein
MALPWKDDRHVTHRSFRIVDLVGDDDLITEKTFEDCTIYGPAVLAPLDRMTFEHNSFEADPEALFWVIPEGRTRVVGAIGLIDCTFRRCIFRRIGIAGKQELIDRFLQATGP